MYWSWIWASFWYWLSPNLVRWYMVCGWLLVGYWRFN